jgi:hypothetical protein
MELGEYWRIQDGQATLGWFEKDYDGSLSLTVDTGSGLEHIKLTDGPNQIASSLMGSSQVSPPIQSGGGITLPPPNLPRVPQEGDPDFVGPVRPPSVLQFGGITITTVPGATAIAFGNNYEVIVYNDGQVKLTSGSQYIRIMPDGSARGGNSAGEMQVLPPPKKKNCNPSAP